MLSLLRDDVHRAALVAHHDERTFGIVGGNGDQPICAAGSGKGRSSTPSTRLKIAVFAPMPKTSVSTAIKRDSQVAPHHARRIAHVLQKLFEPEPAPLSARYVLH